jgi:DNA ligase-1
MRAFWDGGISRGKVAKSVPYANMIAGDDRNATGLWSRLMKPIAAPEWFLDRLPAIPLDGELWLGPGMFEKLVSITKKYVPVDNDWQKVKYRVFDSPHPMVAGLPVEPGLFDYTIRMRNYDEIQELIQLKVPEFYLPQNKLPFRDYQPLLESLLEQTVIQGGEGLMLRHPVAAWEQKRSANILKYKPFTDDEARVIGYTWGEGKYERKLGALIVIWNGITFELSGMTDEGRELYIEGLVSSPTPKTPINPDLIVANVVRSGFFPLGTKVTFRYRTLTEKGVPREARYLRKA